METPADRHVDDGVQRRTDYDFHADADKELGGGEEDMEEEKAFEPEVNPHCVAAKAKGWVHFAFELEVNILSSLPDP